MRLLSKLAVILLGICHGVDVTGNSLVRREAGRSDEPPKKHSALQTEAVGVSGEVGKEGSSGIYGEAMDDSLSRFLVSSQALSDQNLQWLEIPWAGDATPWENRSGAAPPVEQRLASALEVAKVAEAAATRATAMVAAQAKQLREADSRIHALEAREASNEKELREAKNASNTTEAELQGLEMKEAVLGTRQDNVVRVVKDIEGKVVEFGTAAVRAEHSADEAEEDAVRAKNHSDQLKATQAIMKYQLDDLTASLEELLKEQNITRKAERLLLLKSLGLGRIVNEMNGSLGSVNGSIESLVRQAMESMRLAQQAKEESDDALDDVEEMEGVSTTEEEEDGL